MKNMLWVLAWVFVVAYLLIGYFIEFPFLFNLVHGSNMLGIAIAFGLVTGLVTGRYLSRNSTDFIHRTRITLIFTFLGIFLFPLVCSQLNRIFSSGEVKMICTLQKTDPRYISRFGISKGETLTPAYILYHCKCNGSLIRIRQNEHNITDLKPGDQVLVSGPKGFFQVNLLNRIERKQESEN